MAATAGDEVSLNISENMVRTASSSYAREELRPIWEAYDGRRRERREDCQQQRDILGNEYLYNVSQALKGWFLLVSHLHGRIKHSHGSKDNVEDVYPGLYAP